MQRDLAQLKSDIQILRNTVVHVQTQVNDGLTLALCTPEVRQLLEDVQRECVTECTTKQIRTAVLSADPEHQGRFLKLMSHVPHEVLYVAQGASAAVPFRVERLERLIRPALLQSTRFIVVSSPEVNASEAVRRAEIVERLLTTRGIPAQTIRRWIYAFPARAADIIRPVDFPGLGETKELYRGVWGLSCWYCQSSIARCWIARCAFARWGTLSDWTSGRRRGCTTSSPLGCIRCSAVAPRERELATARTTCGKSLCCQSLGDTLQTVHCGVSATQERRGRMEAQIRGSICVPGGSAK